MQSSDKITETGPEEVFKAIQDGENAVLCKRGTVKTPAGIGDTEETAVIIIMNQKSLQNITKKGSFFLSDFEVLCQDKITPLVQLQELVDRQQSSIRVHFTDGAVQII